MKKDNVRYCDRCGVELTMGMTLDEAIEFFDGLEGHTPQAKDARDVAIDTMRKYQKIEDIYYHQSGEALENSLRAVVEDGKID